VEVEPAQGARLVVGTADDKGVVIRKSAEEKAVDEPNDQDTYKPACMESKPPKSHSGKQKMAILGAAYSIEPNPRTPEEVLESLFRTPDGKRPEQTAKPRPSRCANTFAPACSAMRRIRYNRLGKRFAIGWRTNIGNAILVERICRF
jgi:hypothetical protein